MKDTEAGQPLRLVSSDQLGLAPAYLADGRTAYPADVVARWPAHNRARMTEPLYSQATLAAELAAERKRLVAALRQLRRDFAAVPLNAAGREFWRWIDGGCVGEHPKAERSR